MSQQQKESIQPNKVSQDAYSEIVKALSKDMPLIMHGSGDVPPSQVNPETVRLLSELTANYISNLVEAAVDAQEILNNGQRLPLPPPPPRRKEDTRKPPPPSPYVFPPSTADDAKDRALTGSTTTTSGKTNKKSQAAKKAAAAAAAAAEEERSYQQNRKRRIRRDVEYWDDPLPEPKIRNKSKPPPVPEGKVIDGVPIGDWVGVAGVDFFEDSRARSAYVSAPAALTSANFTFPVCHDPVLYGRLLDITSARRSIQPILANTTIQDVIRNEGALQGAVALRKRREKKRTTAQSGGDDDDDEPEATDSEDEDTGAAWPSLEELLPVHTSKDFLKSMM
jgi:hypothetical protein